jgi:hypothetical protein
MKKVVMSIAVAGMVSSLSAADLGANDAAYLFGQDNANVVTMSNMEMVQTEGQVLGLLDPVLGLAGGLPVAGDLLGVTSMLDPVLGIVTGLVSGDVLGTALGLVGGLPVVGDVAGSVLGLANPAALIGVAGAVVGAAQPVKVNVQAGSLLNVNSASTAKTSLPTLVGGLL